MMVLRCCQTQKSFLHNRLHLLEMAASDQRLVHPAQIRVEWLGLRWLLDERSQYVHLGQEDVLRRAKVQETQEAPAPGKIQGD